MDPIPNTYSEWRDCIEIRCQIPITASYCRERIEDLTQMKSHHATQFRKLYGAEYTQQVLSWFQQALQEAEKK